MPGPALGRLGRVRVLLLGSGAREHALARALSLDPDVSQILALPGNPGIARLAHLLPGDPTDPVSVVDLARQQQVDLVVVGPEAPLVAGVADALKEAGVPCFGPTAAAAGLEGSKAFAKEVMAAAGVPTAACHVCTTPEEVDAALRATGAPYVVKEDGLAAGKGVVVTADPEAAAEHARACLARQGGRVVVEDYLDGPEVSLFCLADGATVVPLEPAQDFKRVGDGDAGPNTGGMGAYSPLPWLERESPDLVNQVVSRVAQPTIEEMARRGTPFTGVLYVGLALTSAGPRVIEFNARFGDPETQSVLARLETPLAGVLLAAAEGRLAQLPPLRWSPQASVTVVVAADGYPAAPRTGDPVTGLDAAAAVDGVHVLHAGTREADGRLVSAGGRVLSVVSLGHDLARARARAYAAVHQIALDGSFFRTDIARAAEQGQITVPRATTPDPRSPGDAPVELPGHELVHVGKVRGLYAPLDDTGRQDDSRLLLVASDRVSAYDHVLDTPIPDKGAVLTRLSQWWFDQLADLAPHHVVSTDVPDEVAGRAVYVRRLRMLPVECVARAYLTGGGLAEYAATGTVSGVPLPEGLVDGSRLPEPVFTPSTKAAAGAHDEPISLAQVEDLVGPRLAARLHDLTVSILLRGNEIAAKKGILIADTKVEFGVDPQQLADALGITTEQALHGGVDWAAVDPGVVDVVLADEVLTPDSSRFWRAQEWAPGRTQTSYDKQVLRDWLTSPASGWDRSSDLPPPPLPDDVVALTRARYVEAYETLTGTPFSPPTR